MESYTPQDKLLHFRYSSSKELSPLFFFIPQKQSNKFWKLTLKVKGVVDVITSKDYKANPVPPLTGNGLIAMDTVRYYGDVLGLVVVEDQDTALKAV